MTKRLALSIAIAMLFSPAALGHGGRTDSLGCHNVSSR